MEWVDYKYADKSTLSVADRKALEKEQDKLEEQQRKLEDQQRDVSHSIREVKEKLGDDKIARMVRNFKLSADHVKLLKQMSFLFYKEGGDYVLIGVEGKRPFGNSSITDDVCEILGWKYPDEDEMSSSEYDRRVEVVDRKAGKIIEELPMALNAIMKKLPLPTK